MSLVHQATVISMSPVRLVVAAVSQQYIVIFSMLLRKQDTGLTHSKYFCLMLHCQICKINLSYLLLWLLCIDRQGLYTGLAFTDLINSFGVKQNVTGPTHRYNHTLDLIITHGIDLTDIDIVPQSDDVTDHFLVSCMLRITDINCRAPRYRPGRTIVPATKDRFTNNLPDLSQLLCVPINTNELDKMTSNMGTILSNTLETVAPIKLKKVRGKRAVPWYNSYTHSLKKETRNLERKWRKTNLEVFRIAWKNSMSSYRQALKLPGPSISANS